MQVGSRCRNSVNVSERDGFDHGILNNLSESPPPEQAPTNAISVNFSDVPGGLKVNVNNSSSVAGTCTYDATAPNSLIPSVHRDFTVGANAGTSFQITGIRTGTQYNTVTVCRGNFQGKDVEIGRVELTRSF
jgi:hypothetical protein